MDFSRSLRENYTEVHAVMDEALFQFHTHGGHIAHMKERKGSGLPSFKCNETFPCLQQALFTVMDTYFVIHHINEYIRSIDTLDLAKDVVKWGKQLEKKKDGDHRDELSHIQVKLANIINKDAIDDQGVFHGGVDSPGEVIARLEQ
jgi:hypothetical protein